LLTLSALELTTSVARGNSHVQCWAARTIHGATGEHYNTCTLQVTAGVPPAAHLQVPYPVPLQHPRHEPQLRGARGASTGAGAGECSGQGQHIVVAFDTARVAHIFAHGEVQNAGNGKLWANQHVAQTQKYSYCRAYGGAAPQ
jgi:hypothetical protein